MEETKVTVSGIESLIHMFVSGGFWMYVILAVLLAALIITVERWWSLYVKAKPSQSAFIKQFEIPIKMGKLDVVASSAEGHSRGNPAAPIVAAGVHAAINFGGREEIQNKMDEVLMLEHGKLERRTPFLAMLANVGTLTGLLGTIVGMIKSFTAVGSAEGVEKASMLANGISEAMNTTAFGLIMAIPTLIVYAILVNRSNQLKEDLDHAVLKVSNWLNYSFEPSVLKQKSSGETRTPSIEAGI